MLTTLNYLLLHLVIIASEFILNSSPAPLWAANLKPRNVLPSADDHLGPPANAGAQRRSSVLRLYKASAQPHRVVKVPSAPAVTKPKTQEELQNATSWLQEFGYLSEPLYSGAVDENGLAFRVSLRKLQRYGRLPVTGILDHATVTLMAKPRCGEKDFHPAGGRHKRYILLRRRWQRGREIDIQFRNHTTDMTIDEQEAIMSYVVDQWNSAADARLVFHQDGDQIEFPEINIHHSRFDNLGRPFRPYGVLAYAALPRNGDMFFDDTERWSEFHRRRPISFSYKAVALHELGHSLGFAHSQVPSAVMYAFYGANRHKLTQDDVAGAVAMFGPT